MRVKRDHADRVTARDYLQDPERQEVIARLFDLAFAGIADAPSPASSTSRVRTLNEKP